MHQDVVEIITKGIKVKEEGKKEISYYLVEVWSSLTKYIVGKDGGAHDVRHNI